MHHQAINCLFRVWYQRHEVLIHGRSEALFVGVWRYDRWILITNLLLEEAFELLLERVLLNVVDNAETHRFLHWVDYDKH